MALTQWIISGRKADVSVIKATLTTSKIEKLARLLEIRTQLEGERQMERDGAAISKETKKRWREADLEARKLEAELRKVRTATRKAEREASKSIYAYAQPYGGGQISERELKRFDTMFHPKRSFERKADGLFSFHCKFTSRGFGTRRKDRSRTYKRGEAVKHVRYIIRELAREIALGGLVSNISRDSDELAGFFATLEELESHDRDNANVYMSLVISLPHELTSAGRERVLSEICDLLAEQGLPYVGVLHAPDLRGDQRNFHTHIMFSLRPCEVEAPGRYVFSPHKYSDLNDETFIYPFRCKVADILNDAMTRENQVRRFTALSDADRGLEPRAKGSGKSTPGQKHWERKKEDLVAMQLERMLRFRRKAVLERLSARVAGLMAAPARDFRQAIATRRAATLSLLQNNVAAFSSAAANRALRIEKVATATLIAGRERLVSFGERMDSAQSLQGQPVPASMDSETSFPDTSIPVHEPASTISPPPASTAGAHAQSLEREMRGSDVRRALAAAAWQLRRAPYPPQVRDGDHFTIHESAASRFEDVICLGAEPLIQAIHARKRSQMLAAVRQKVEGLDRSPFVEADGRARLPSAIFDQPLQNAVRLAYRDPDYLALLTELHAFWRERERASRLAEAKRREEAKARQDRMAPGIAEIYGAMERRVQAGKWPADKVEAILGHVDTIASAVRDGRMVMRSTDEGAYFCLESEGLRTIAGMLADTAPGRAILTALGKLTLNESLNPAELPYVWAPASALQAVPTPQAAVDQGLSRGNGKSGSVER